VARTLTPEQRQQIAELRASGLSINKVAAIVGCGRSAVINNSRTPDGKRRTTEHDPRFQSLEFNEEDEYADVVPIPFYPDDLPVLQTDKFAWTEQEMAQAINTAHRLRYIDSYRYHFRKEAQHDRYCP
jgi:hypothetical protein